MPFPLAEHNREAIEAHFRKRRKRQDFAWTEDFFIDVLRSSQDKYDLNYAAQALRAVGTVRAVPFLKPLVHFTNNDVRAIVLLTVAHIARGAESRWYSELLVDPKFRMKDYAIWAIQEAGDESALEAVEGYFTDKRRLIEAGKLESFQIAMGRDYLQRIGASSSKAAQLLEDAWTSVAEDERERHLKQINYHRAQA
ncbi:MAG TPA: hypothetical protein PKE21_08145 [Flavobacteriales bacterium]|nr:hypothetical protein [Flavobacteriales bacterium]HMR27431.1 hypothetical protein [Flavobacteriales bacterium]